MGRLCLHKVEVGMPACASKFQPHSLTHICWAATSGQKDTVTSSLAQFMQAFLSAMSGSMPTQESGNNQMDLTLGCRVMTSMPIVSGSLQPSPKLCTLHGRSIQNRLFCAQVLCCTVPCSLRTTCLNLVGRSGSTARQYKQKAALKVPMFCNPQPAISHPSLLTQTLTAGFL